MNKDILTGWRIGISMGVILFLIIFNLAILSASETRNIEYVIQVTHKPYCEVLSCSSVMTNVTNTTTLNQTICSEKCYTKLTFEGIAGNNLFFEMDTKEEKWESDVTEFRYGYKTADLGNLSDITGIREDLKNCTTGWKNLVKCQNALRIYDVNLTNCNNKVGDGNYSIDVCKIDKTNLENQLSSKTSELKLKTDEIKNNNNTKWFYGIGGALLCWFFIKQGLPYLKNKQTPSDSSEKQFASNPGY